MNETAERAEINSIAKDIVKKIENDDLGGADQAILDLVQRRSQELYFAVGNLTRDVHESISDLIARFNDNIDPGGINEIAKDKVPDARERLSFVIEKSDYACEKTVESVTAIQPLVEQLMVFASELSQEKQKSGTFDPTQVEELVQQVNAQGSKIQSNITEVLMAQQHQTLASQVVTKTFNLVCEIESKMVALVALAGTSEVAMESQPAKNTDEMYGPAIGHEDDVVHGQEDVDDLLSSLGF